MFFVKKFFFFDWIKVQTLDLFLIFFDLKNGPLSIIHQKKQNGRTISQ